MSTTKNFIRNHHILKNVDMDDSVNSSVLDITGLDHIAIEAVWDSGTSPSGNVRIEVSITGDNWLLIGTAVTVSGNSGVGFSRSTFSEPVVQFPLCRVRYQRTGGDGNLNVYLCGKES